MHQIIVNDIVVDVVRKNIKNLHLAVYPPNGRVRVAAPLHVNDEAVRLYIIAKLTWIKQQQARFEGQERQSSREFVSGESHYYQGQRYLLNVVYQEGTPCVSLRQHKYLDLCVQLSSTTAERERVLLTWYRQQLKQEMTPLIDHWEEIIGAQADQWSIRKMKTKWGTCHIEERHIWLNLELIKKPAHCLEYVIVHELVHLLERHHNDRFIAYMNSFMPLWQHYRQELNQSPLKEENWQ